MTSLALLTIVGLVQVGNPAEPNGLSGCGLSKIISKAKVFPLQKLKIPIVVLQVSLVLPEARETLAPLTFDEISHMAATRGDRFPLLPQNQFVSSNRVFVYY